MKKKIIILISIIVFAIFLITSVIVSANLTGVLNPISSVYNMSKIILDDELYVVAQKNLGK